jgi:hypothetical protein
MCCMEEGQQSVGWLLDDGSMFLVEVKEGGVGMGLFGGVLAAVKEAVVVVSPDEGATKGISGTVVCEFRSEGVGEGKFEVGGWRRVLT